MNIPIGLLPLSKTKLNKLKENGFTHVHEFFSEDAKRFLFDVDDEEIKFLNSQPTVCSALDLLDKESKFGQIKTFCKSLDTILGGGIELNSITDICGVTGTGKTQICHQICITTQLPEYFGGLNGDIIYIDTYNNFSTQRILDMALACIEHCEKINEKRKTKSTIPKLDEFLNRIKIFQPLHDPIEEFISLLLNIRKFITTNTRLIIIDSFSQPFLLHFTDLLERTALLSDTLLKLQQITQEFNLAIVTTSQMTTMVNNTNGTFDIIPSMGQGYFHQIKNRILVGQIHTPEKRRGAEIIKSSNQPGESADFKIVTAGIRDINVKD